MAIKPAINPRVAVTERPATFTGAMNFISGGGTLGESIVASAANKIIGFQRGATAVAPKPPDLGSIINTLSTNILSNVENKLQSVNQNIQQVIQNKFLSQLGDYRNRIQEITSNPPSKILQNFLSLYKEALGYIQFLGNRKNIKRLGDNLQALQNVFTDTFRVAALVRSTIVKIVKQLSNLPTASSGPGGLNLDINVPGGQLKKAASSKGNLLKMVGMGAAVSGAGALGTKVVSGMMDIGGDVQAAPISEGTIPGTLLDRFSSILDRFSQAINSLSNVKRSQPSSSRNGTATPPKSEDGKYSPGATPSTPSGPADFSGSANTEKAFNYFISQGYTKEQSAGIVGNLMQENRALDPKVTNKIGHKGIAQWDPDIRYPGLTKFAKSKGLDPNTLEAQLQYVEEELKTGSGGLSKEKLQGTKSVEESALLVRKQYLRPGESEAMDVNRIKFGQQVLSQYGGKVQPGKPGVAGKPGESGVPGKPGVVGTPGTTSSVTAAPTQAVNQQQLAQTVSRPPTQQKPQISLAPINLSSLQAQSTKVGDKMMLPPMMSKGGATMPFLPSSNEDNFFTMLSKVVYNIVDG